MTIIISKKICMLGDFSVGKTSLIRRFVERQFSDQYLSTVGVKISRKTVEFTSKEQEKQVNVQMLIWDLEGNTKFKTVTPMYMQGSSGAIIVSDFSRQFTFDHIPSHIESFLAVNPTGIVIVALNKSDIADEKKIDKMLSYHPFNAKDKVIATYPTSAKTGLYVDKIFHQLAYRMATIK